MPQQGYYRQFPDQSSPLAYELPDQRYIGQPNSPAPGQQSPYNPVLPVEGTNNPLAEVEGLTDSYYDSYSKLRAYAQSMHKDYGLDVTAPNLDQPGGGLPFKTYQKLEANLMGVANKLSNRQKEITQMKPYEAEGKVVQRGEGNYETQALLPEVQDALKKIDGPFYNKAEADRAKERIIGPLLAQLQQQQAAGHNDPMLKHNIEVLQGAGTTYGTYPGLYTFQPKDTAADKAHLKAVAGATREVGVLKRFTALKNGYWEKGSYQVRKDPSTGKPELENRSHEGEIFGSTMINNSAGVPQKIQRVVDAWVRKPDKSVWVTFKPDPETGTAPPPVRVDNQDGSDVTAVFQQGNPKFGQSPQMYQAIDILGHSDPGNTGGLNEPSLYGDDMPKLDQDRNGLDEELGGHVRVEDAKTKLDADLDNLGSKAISFTGRDSFDVTLPNGKTVQFKSHLFGNKFFAKGVGENLTKEDIQKYLDEQGYFDQFKKGGAGQSVTPDDFNAKWGSLKPGESLVGPDGKTYTKK